MQSTHIDHAARRRAGKFAGGAIAAFLVLPLLFTGPASASTHEALRTPSISALRAPASLGIYVSNEGVLADLASNLSRNASRIDPAVAPSTWKAAVKKTYADFDEAIRQAGRDLASGLSTQRNNFHYWASRGHLKAASATLRELVSRIGKMLEKSRAAYMEADKRAAQRF